MFPAVGLPTSPPADAADAPDAPDPPPPFPPPPASDAPSGEPDLSGCSKEELVRRLRREESEKLAALVQRGRLIQGVNRQLQEHLREIRELKAVNGRLQAENRELRDLCCFLDEDRLKAKRLARHWQLFGHHAAQVLRDEVAGCLRKLAGLEGLQERLAQDNLELKELCLALEDCAAAAAATAARPDASPSPGGGSSELSLPCGPRDLGDGSSSTGSVGSPDQPHPACSPDE
ncbi:coiled-coil domain-containing protein 85B-like [Pantherophis guttatus]|uniref:Coiled-coil domain-containing protein 85B-like n=1 Tax=Pantherophis guttatus TaxID=94885 RepID=A0ABM3ZPR1_PANGU|nr:coiled-coil domain-containing protein 85B-like [Pantherophis guttatus]